MSDEFTGAIIARIKEVTDHPDAEHLNINTVDLGDGVETVCISNRKDDGSTRYTSGSIIIYVSPRCLVPEWLLKHNDCWDDENGKGILAGKQGNRVKASNFRGIKSHGMMVATQPGTLEIYGPGGPLVSFATDEKSYFANKKRGENVTEELGIEIWEG